MHNEHLVAVNLQLVDRLDEFITLLLHQAINGRFPSPFSVMLLCKLTEVRFRFSMSAAMFEINIS